MTKKSVRAFPLLFLLLFLNRSFSQVNVYSNPGDSVNVAIGHLTTELEKAGFKKEYQSSPEAFKGKGFLFLQSREADNLKIKYPAVLRTFGPEGVYIKADNNSVQFIGNTALALQEAIYLYLEQLGFRFLLPGEIWNVVPKLSSPYKAVTILTHPDFEHRRISNAHGYGGNKKIETDFESWASANLLGGSFNIKVGHSYGEIVTGNIEAFKQHPEYFSQTTTKGNIPADPKFNVANKDLVKLIEEDAVKRMEQFRKWGWSMNMLSMEPSDGGGFCTTKECKAIGGSSEQVYYLSNRVARVLQQKYPGAWVGGFAYNEHILPPTFKMEPNIFLMVTNGFNRTKYSTTDLLNLWKQKISKVGVYEYLSVYEWDNDMPGQVPAAKTDWVRNTIGSYYANGGNTYLAESVMGWINRGPGEYIVSKLLWNTRVNVDSVKNDFFKNAFEETAPLIRKLYDTWENYPHKIPVESDLVDWHRWVDEAYTKTNNDLIKKRIEQIKLYLHYVLLYIQLKKNPSQDNMLSMMRYAYRNFESAAFATLPTMVSLPTYMGYQQMGWYASPQQVWKTENKPYTREEINTTFLKDKSSLKKGAPITAFKKADGFVKLDKVTQIPSKKYYKSFHTLWGKTEYIISITRKSADNYFEVSSDYAANPPVTRNVEFDIYPLNESAETDKPVLHFEQSKKAIKEKYSFQSLNPGLYVMRVNDQNKMFILEFSASIDYSIVMKPDEKLLTTSAANLNIFYFYVPPGIKNFRVHKTVVVSLRKPTGQDLNFENNRDEVLDIEVKPGEDGIWIAYNQSGSLYIEGVPPYLGLLPDRMLVPTYLKNNLK